MAETGTVNIERLSVEDGTVALLTIDFPPVNAGSLAMRSALLAALRDAAGTEGLTGLVLTGAGGNFVGGADLTEFDAPAQPPHLPEVIELIETCPVPVVAAIDGAALGGGFEIALGCDARVATGKAIVGLPEVTLGLIPGAGGTLRTQRLVGQAETIALITSGRRVRAAEALTLGLVDAVTEADLLEAALAFLRAMPGKRILRDLPAKPCEQADINSVEAAAMAKARGSEAVADAIQAIRDSAALPVDEALARERESSLRLRRSEQSQALRHLFFAERAAGRPPAGAQPRDVKTVGIVGGGRMGQGIAIAFAKRGYAVRLAERNPEFLQKALDAIAGSAGDMEARGHAESASAITDAITGSGLEQFGDCGLVVEAIIEDRNAKIALFRQLDTIVGDQAVLATNTSYLDIDEIAAATVHPERVAGLHFFNPAHVMRLVEVVRTMRSDPDTLATLLTVARRLGKVPVLAGVCDGFIGNRIFAAYRRQCEFLLEEGALPEQVDAAMTAFGMPLGPFAVFDLTGLEIAWARRKRQAPSRNPKARYVSIPDTLCEAGRLGRSAGKGWYDYSEAKRGTPDPAVTAIIEATSASKGIIRRAIGEAEIQSRLLAATINEACHLLAEGIAERASDVDVVLVRGYGFPALKGGPLFWASRRDRGTMRKSVQAMVEASGHGFDAAPNLDAVLDSLNPG